MGTTAARKAMMILDNAQKVLSIELMTASQALSFHDESQMAPITSAILKTIRQEVAPSKKDIIMYKEMNKVFALVKEEKIWRSAKEACGDLQ